jgi:hypothetical protein
MNPGSLVTTSATYMTDCHDSLMIDVGLWTGRVTEIFSDTFGILVSTYEKPGWRSSGTYVVWPGCIGWCDELELAVEELS